jgi:hypothetical protein
MLTVTKVRNLYESRARRGSNPGAGRQAFVAEIRHLLGLCDARGNNYTDRNGGRCLRLTESSMRAEEFSLQELALACIGPTYTDYFNPGNPASLLEARRYTSWVEGQHPGDSRALLEAVGVGVDVSQFADINAWTGVVGGLIERKILEAFESPEFIMDKVMPTVPSRVAEGQKVIGISRLGDLAEERQPGQAHKRATVGQRYVQLKRTRENALAVDVEKEAVFFDLTGQLLPHAGNVGDWLRFRKEIDQIDATIGVSSSTGSTTGKYAWQYNSATVGGLTTYGLYNAGAGATIGKSTLVNSLSNQMQDWTNVQTAWLQFQRYLDPETGTRIRGALNTVIVNPALMATAHLIFEALNNQRRSAGSGTQSNAQTLQIGNTNGSPVDYFGNFEILYSPLIEQRCTDATGLNLSQANANIYWWILDKARAFAYYQNWPLTITQAPPSNYDMIDRGVVASYFANERGMPAVLSPWHAIQNTN